MDVNKRCHELKLLWTFEDAILNGEKCFEVRENDRGFQKGDLVRFKVVDDRPFFERPYQSIHAIEKMTYRITYVLNGWGLKNGYVVFGFREEANDSSTDN